MSVHACCMYIGLVLCTSNLNAHLLMHVSEYMSSACSPLNHASIILARQSNPACVAIVSNCFGRRLEAGCKYLTVMNKFSFNCLKL